MKTFEPTNKPDNAVSYDSLFFPLRFRANPLPLDTAGSGVRNQTSGQSGQPLQRYETHPHVVSESCGPECRDLQEYATWNSCSPLIISFPLSCICFSFSLENTKRYDPDMVSLSICLIMLRKESL